MVEVLFKSDNLKCSYFVDNSADPSKYKMHAHEKYELLYFVSGKAFYLVEGTKYSIDPGDVMIMRIGEAHKLIIDPSEPYKRMIIHFKKDILPQSAQYLLNPFNNRDIGEMNSYKSSDFQSTHYKHCLNAILNNTKDNETPEIFIKTNLLAFLFDLNSAYTALIKPEKEKSNLKRCLINYVNKNLTKEITLESISSEFFVSKTQLNRIFREATGSSLWSYVVVKRLIKARNKIRSGTSPGEACEECGFKDYSSFYRLYKKQFDCHPSNDIKANR